MIMLIHKEVLNSFQRDKKGPTERLVFLMLILLKSF